MGEDGLRLITTLCSVLGAIIPAIWFLSSKIQKMHGSLIASNAKIEVKIFSLEKQMQSASGELACVRRDTNELRERVVRLETLGRLPPPCGD